MRNQPEQLFRDACDVSFLYIVSSYPRQVIQFLHLAAAILVTLAILVFLDF